MNFGVFIAFCGFTATELASGISVCSPLRIIIFTQTLPGTLLLKFIVNLRNLRKTLSGFARVLGLSGRER